jgi:hypothetical protein
MEVAVDQRAESDAGQAENDAVRRQHAVLARFGEMALRSEDLDDILTEACRLVGSGQIWPKSWSFKATA